MFLLEPFSLVSNELCIVVFHTIVVCGQCFEGLVVLTQTVVEMRGEKDVGSSLNW